MGYYSRYMLKCDGCSNEAAIAALGDIQPGYFAKPFSEYDIVDGYILLSTGWNGIDKMKWYECRDDMEKLSDAIPTATFELVKIGESWRFVADDPESGDVVRYTYGPGGYGITTYGVSTDGKTATFPE